MYKPASWYRRTLWLSVCLAVSLAVCHKPVSLFYRIETAERIELFLGTEVTLRVSYTTMM